MNMGFGSLLRFANSSDLKRGLANSKKAIRVVYRNSIGKQTTNVSKLSEFDDIREDILAEVLDTDKKKVRELVDDVRTSEIYERIQECEKRIEHKPYSLGGMQLGGETAYLLTRLIKPKSILEVGVANGVSTAYVLGALGELKSTADIRAIDKPQFESQIRSQRGKRGLSGVGGIIPNKQEAGWVAPKDQRSKHGHQYYVGDFTKILPKVTNSMPPIDLAIYDASKDSKEMKMAYDTLIQSLSPNGILISDDIGVNNSFTKVADSHNGSAYEFGGIGIFHKRKPG